jgi:hypothetical protein
MDVDIIYAQRRHAHRLKVKVRHFPMLRDMASSLGRALRAPAPDDLILAAALDSRVGVLVNGMR